MSNAYTSMENTNYYIDVQQEHFAGALDRFAQFFIKPLFTQSATDRELNAIECAQQRAQPRSPCSPLIRTRCCPQLRIPRTYRTTCGAPSRSGATGATWPALFSSDPHPLLSAAGEEPVLARSPLS